MYATGQVFNSVVEKEAELSFFWKERTNLNYVFKPMYSRNSIQVDLTRNFN